jgi:hypothetical protein
MSLIPSSSDHLPTSEKEHLPTSEKDHLPTSEEDHLPTCEEEMMMNMEDCQQIQEKEIQATTTLKWPCHEILWPAAGSLDSAAWASFACWGRFGI